MQHSCQVQTLLFRGPIFDALFENGPIRPNLTQLIVPPNHDKLLMYLEFTVSFVREVQEWIQFW